MPKPADVDGLGAQVHRPARKIERDANPGTVFAAQPLHRDLAGIAERVEFALVALRVEGLTRVSLPVEQADSDHRRAEIGRRLGSA